MKRLILLVPFALLAACASYPDRVIGPASPPSTALAPLQPSLGALHDPAVRAPHGATRNDP